MRRRMRKQEEQQTQQERAAAVSNRDERALPFDSRDASVHDYYDEPACSACREKNKNKRRPNMRQTKCVCVVCACVHIYIYGASPSAAGPLDSLVARWLGG